MRKTQTKHVSFFLDRIYVRDMIYLFKQSIRPFYFTEKRKRLLDRCDFSSIMTILRSYVRENNQLNQSEFLYEVFDDFLSSPEGADFSFDNGLVCRWMSGQAKVSPKLINYYSAKSSQLKLSDTLEHMILPMMFDPDKALSDVYLLWNGTYLYQA